jgi:hypothetical protein
MRDLIEGEHYKISQFYRRKNSVGDFFTDGLRPSAFLSSVIPPSVAISVGKTKNHLPIVLHTEFARQKKRFPLEIYRRICILLVIL